ncbi:MAG: Crp/Fnr family transcriptional regulator [Roseburia sp.]|nr:Crp/Fnr family transcriptional regulator [Roseburia sp.]
MEARYLEQAVPFLKKMEGGKREQFITYFKTAPVWLLESFSTEEMDKGTIFVREGEPVETIFFILDGTIKATDYRFYGITFDFMCFEKVYAMGGMEIIMDLPTYRTTLQTVTKCHVLKIPKTKFEKWIKTDIEALKLEAKLVGEYLLEQGRSSRAYLFLQGSDRLAMLFVQRYETYAQEGILSMKGDRQGLSDATGLCIKTINRGVKKFSDEGIITKNGRQIVIDHDQYIRLKSIVASVIEPD